MLAFAVAAASGHAWAQGAVTPALYKRRITVDTSAMGGPAVDGLVVPVRLSIDDGFDPAHAPGGLLRFEDDAGTPLPYEVERWDPTGTSSLWVRLAGEPTLWVFYGGADDGQSRPDADATWQGALGVWHLSDQAPDGDCTDLLGAPILCGTGGDTLLASGSTPDLGLVGDGRALPADTHLTRLPDDSDPIDTVTLELWARLDDGEPSWRDTFVAGPNWAVHRCRFGRIGVFEEGHHNCIDSVVEATERWHQVVLTVGPSTIDVWIDGVLLFDQAQPGYAWSADLSEVWFGAAPYFAGYGLDGTIDEVRAYPGPLSGDRIHADFVAMRQDGPQVVTVGREVLVAEQTTTTPSTGTSDTGGEDPPPSEDPDRQLVGGRCGCDGGPSAASVDGFAVLVLAWLRRRSARR